MRLHFQKKRRLLSGIAATTDTINTRDTSENPSVEDYGTITNLYSRSPPSKSKKRGNILRRALKGITKMSISRSRKISSNSTFDSDQDKSADEEAVFSVTAQPSTLSIDSWRAPTPQYDLDFNAPISTNHESISPQKINYSFTGRKPKGREIEIVKSRRHEVRNSVSQRKESAYTNHQAQSECATPTLESRSECFSLEIINEEPAKRAPKRKAGKTSYGFYEPDNDQNPSCEYKPQTEAFVGTKFKGIHLLTHSNLNELFEPNQTYVPTVLSKSEKDRLVQYNRRKELMLRRNFQKRRLTTNNTYAKSSCEKRVSWDATLCQYPSTKQGVSHSTDDETVFRMFNDMVKI